jgi:hypothetical protein
VQRYVRIAGGRDEHGKEFRAMLGALPVTKNSKTRVPANDTILVPGDVIRLDRCPAEIFIVFEIDTKMETSVHR